MSCAHPKLAGAPCPICEPCAHTLWIIATSQPASEAAHRASAHVPTYADGVAAERARTAPYVAALEKVAEAARRAAPYLASCIHEIACNEDHEDCPAELEDVPLRELRAALKTAAPGGTIDPAQRAAWEDVRDEWTDAISAAHPTRSEAHDEYGTAMQMVGHRHSKGALVALVTWLLVERRSAYERGVREALAICTHLIATSREERTVDLREAEARIGELIGKGAGR